jgi:FkbM family methyltransferase
MKYGARVLKSLYGPKFVAKYEDKTFRLYICGSYGTEFSSLIAGYERCFSFLDIGANQGLYSILAARNSCCTGFVAIEPVARTHSILVENISLNRVLVEHLAIKAAVSNRNGGADIGTFIGHSGRATLLELSGEVEVERTESVEVVDGHRLVELSEEILTGELIIKVDVEGSEEVVLEQLDRGGLLERTSIICIEIDTRKVDRDAIVANLADQGFFHFVELQGATKYDLLASKNLLELT